MSRREKQLIRDLVSKVRKERAANKTISDYTKIMTRVGTCLAKLNIQIKDAEHIKVKHVEQYMESRKNEALSTLQPNPAK